MKHIRTQCERIHGIKHLFIYQNYNLQQRIDMTWSWNFLAKRVTIEQLFYPAFVVPRLLLIHTHKFYWNGSINNAEYKTTKCSRIVVVLYILVLPPNLAHLCTFYSRVLMRSLNISINLWCWAGSVVHIIVRTSDSWSGDRKFDSRSVHCRVA